MYMECLVSRWRETNFNIFYNPIINTSSKIHTRKLFSLVNYVNWGPPQSEWLYQTTRYFIVLLELPNSAAQQSWKDLTD
jgi:hypothetical protein